MCKIDREQDSSTGRQSTSRLAFVAFLCLASLMGIFEPVASQTIITTTTLVTNIVSVNSTTTSTKVVMSPSGITTGALLGLFSGIAVAYELSKVKSTNHGMCP